MHDAASRQVFFFNNFETHHYFVEGRQKSEKKTEHTVAYLHQQGGQKSKPVKTPAGGGASENHTNNSGHEFVILTAILTLDRFDRFKFRNRETENRRDNTTACFDLKAGRHRFFKTLKLFICYNNGKRNYPPSSPKQVSPYLLQEQSDY